jgi:hypothetical protein
VSFENVQHSRQQLVGMGIDVRIGDRPLTVAAPPAAERCKDSLVIALGAHARRMPSENVARQCGGSTSLLVVLGTLPASVMGTPRSGG